MDVYHKILKSLNISNTLSNLIDQKIEIPYLGNYQNVNNYWYQHPPCLIPIFLGYGSEYRGILNHFFSNRKNVFIQYDLEWGYFNEISRTENQFYTDMLVNMIMLEDDEVTSIVEKFSRDIHFNGLEEIYLFTSTYGDDFSEYENLIYFNKKTPAYYVQNIVDYDGDFPCVIGGGINNIEIPNSSGFEISKFNLEKISEKPLWLIENTDKKDLFNYYLNNNQLKEAWLTLNSKDWLMSDVPNALIELNKKGNNDLLSLVVENWIKNYEQHGVKGMYY